MNSISANLNIMIKASEKVSKILIRDFGELEKLQVSKKGPSDFVTNSDLKAEKIIIEELRKARPNFSFISEEKGIEKNKDKKNTWIIDPIDGTVNFLHGIPHFAISIALKSNNEIVSGLIYDPIKNEMFFAEKNNGAFFNNHRVRVSNKSDIEDCLFSSDQDGLKFIYPSLNMRSTGCAALDLAYVGSGRLDGFFHNKINLWDIAAGTLIITEAGGITNDFTEYDYDNINIRAASSTIYKEMTKKLANEASHIFAAGGCMALYLLEDADPSFSPTPIIEVHGILDVVIPYSNSHSSSVIFDNSLVGDEGALKNIATWADMNGCSGIVPEMIEEYPDYSIQGYSDCDEDVEIQLITLHLADHNPYPSANPTGIQTTQMVWDFMDRFTLEPEEHDSDSSPE